MTTPIEIAREVAADLSRGDGGVIHRYIMQGDCDNTLAIRAALAMHARLTAAHEEAVRELVEGLERIKCAASKHSANEKNDPCGIFDEIAKDARALLAKHRAPDAFEKVEK